MNAVTTSGWASSVSSSRTRSAISSIKRSARSAGIRSGGCDSGDDTSAYIYGNAARCLVAQPRSGLLIQNRECLAALRAYQAARHGGIGRPGENPCDGLRLLLPGDQEDDAAGAAQRGR